MSIIHYVPLILIILKREWEKLGGRDVINCIFIIHIFNIYDVHICISSLILFSAFIIICLYGINWTLYEVSAHLLDLIALYGELYVSCLPEHCICEMCVLSNGLNYWFLKYVYIHDILFYLLAYSVIIIYYIIYKLFRSWNMLINFLVRIFPKGT